MIGGNTELILKRIKKDESTFDENGKRKVLYESIASLFGWLDLTSGDSKYDYKAKIEDSTHVFICDFEKLDDTDIENLRATIDGKDYDIKYIDDPMRLHQHLEIYLKLVGGQNET